MISQAVQQEVLQVIQQSMGTAIRTLRFSSVGGGSINDTYRAETNTSRQFFCKFNSQSKFPGLFEAEQKGLELLRKQKLVRVPEVYGTFVTEDCQGLVMEWIEQGMRTAAFWKLFGQQLAALHAVDEQLFGLPYNNYMGALPQHNGQTDSWRKFFAGQRLEPQVKLAVQSALLSAQEAAQFDKVYKRLKDIFPSAVPRLLHGDLWSGNFLCDEQGRPVLIDPAVYYGHPAIDLGMTTLFGGFDKVFYDTYRHYLPFPPNYHEQWEVCNLYPLLIHLNLFGESYKPAILSTIRRY